MEMIRICAEYSFIWKFSNSLEIEIAKNANDLRKWNSKHKDYFLVYVKIY